MMYNYNIVSLLDLGPHPGTHTSGGPTFWSTALKIF